MPSSFIKFCKVCSKRYVCNHGSQKYCGRKCYFDDKFKERSSERDCQVCNNKVIVYPSTGKKYCSRECYYKAPKSEEFKQKISQAFRGERHPRWKGGVMKGRKDRNLMEYKDWRKAVFSRDHYTCIECGAHNVKGVGHTVVLEADHIKSWTDYAELRYEVDNGRTLCRPCHQKRTAQQHKERMSHVTV